MAEPSPNSVLNYQPNNIYNMDNRAAYANGAAGSVTPLKLFIATLRNSTRNKDWWSRFRRVGRSSPIVFEKRPGAAGGAIVNIRTQGSLGGPGKKGGQKFAAVTDFGKIPHGEIEIQLDLIKQATGMDPHALEMTGLKNADLQLASQLGDWGGKYLTDHTDMTIVHKAAGSSRTVINGKTIATLKSADTISWDAIQEAAALMKDQGGSPFLNGKMANGEELWNLMFPLVDVMATSLKKDPGWKQRISDCTMGTDSPFFSGTIPTLDGNTIMSRQVVVPKGQLAAGSPYAPIAYLGVADAYSAGGANTTLQGGGNMYDASTTTDWFKFFPGNLYPWSEFSTLALADSFWGSGPYYALVVNPLSAATDPGKVGMIAYTVPAGANTLTVTQRLHSAGTTGINETTVGSVTSAIIDASDSAFTADFAKGAAIIPCNADGVPIGICPGIGGDALGFVKGDRWGEQFKDKVEGGLSGEQIFTGWTFGQEPYEEIDGSTPGIVLVACAVSYKGRYRLPSVA